MWARLPSCAWLWPWDEREEHPQCPASLLGCRGGCGTGWEGGDGGRKDAKWLFWQGRRAPAKPGASDEPSSSHPLAASSTGCSQLPEFPIFQLNYSFCFERMSRTAIRRQCAISLMATKGSALPPGLPKIQLRAGGCFSTRCTPAPKVGSRSELKGRQHTAAPRGVKYGHRQNRSIGLNEHLPLSSMAPAHTKSYYVGQQPGHERG